MSNILRNTLGNWETFKEPDGKSLGTHWEQTPLPKCPRQPKTPKTKAPQRLLNWLHEISISKMVSHHLFIYLFMLEQMKSSSIAWSPFSIWTNIHSKLGTRLVVSKAGDQRAGGNPVATDRPSRCTTHHTLRWDLGRTKRVNTCT
jgi:hypothetical protein